MRTNPHRRLRRRGASVVEAAVLLPLMVFFFVIGVDFARVFYHHLTITNAARNGAYYAAQSAENAANLAGITDAALKDATDLTPTPNVTTRNGAYADGTPWVEVEVDYRFRTVTQFPGVPNDVVISRTCQMRVMPKTPKPGTF
jgi:Flp pilus assembly protein TadG